MGGEPGPFAACGLRMMPQPFKLTEAQDVQDLAAVVPAGAVVFVDTLNRAAPTADENSSRDMGEILEAAKRLQSMTRRPVVLVHHTGKDSTRGLRGHSALFAAMDAAMEVPRDGERREWKVAMRAAGAGVKKESGFEQAHIAWTSFQPDRTEGVAGVGALEHLKRMAADGVKVPSVAFDLAEMLRCRISALQLSSLREHEGSE